MTQPPLRQSDTPTILLLKIFHKKYLVILEAADTIYALMLILITQKPTDIDVRKILFKPFFVRHSQSIFFLLLHTHHSIFFLFFGANP